MKGICFKESLFHAVVNGTKTQTRRIIKPQPMGSVHARYGQFFDEYGIELKPRYQVGEKVYLTKEKGVETDIFAKITAVRCERLQDISDEDCFKEGIWKYENVGLNGVTYWYRGCANSPHRAPKEAYAALIDKISGKGTWDSNPYVWVYDFKLTS